MLARRGWLEESAPNGAFARFLIRGKHLPMLILRDIQREAHVHGDLLMLPVDARQHRLRGRLLSLIAWLRAAPTLCTTCQFIAKADDDTHIVLPDYVRALRLVRGRLGDVPSLLGFVQWHTWNTRAFMHHSYFGTYDHGALRESQMAIDYYSGRATRRPLDAGTLKALSRCKPGGVLTGCGWCPAAAECDGPFPFATGWLVTLSRSLGATLLSSAAVEEEVQRASAVNRTRWGPPMLEDIWLGSVLHRLVSCRGTSPQTPLTIVALAESYVFNGDWHTGRGIEFNTTMLFHNKHELPLVAAHARATHARARPELQCGGDAQLFGYREGTGKVQGRYREGTGKAPVTPGGDAQLFGYTKDRLRAHRRYLDDAQCTSRRRWCSLVEPSHLVPPARRWVDTTARINRAHALGEAELQQLEEYRNSVVRRRQDYVAALAGSSGPLGELGRVPHGDSLEA